MANSKQAIKRIRQNEVRRLRNQSVTSRMRSAIKKLRSAVEAKDKEAAGSLLPATLKIIDVTARKRVIHRNTAARYKSRLSHAVAGISD
ncbi:MAG: 30S ribosomal protein S20 [Deltaproteobacteria bacterium]|nr:30S ribosomal protein S20 [Deltaproteobacteria bacterium]